MKDKNKQFTQRELREKFNLVFYDDFLNKVREKYDFDFMVESLQGLIYEVLREEGLEDLLDDFIKFMPTSVIHELKTMMDDNS